MRDTRTDIARWPTSHSPCELPPGSEGDVRSAPVKGFPYRLIYLVAPDIIWVLACAHTRRKPMYWVDRM